MATATSNGPRKVRFGLFEADLRAGELFRGGARVRLQEQPFRILSMLIERPGEVITREELRDRLWPADTFVDFDHSLNAAIRRLRDALGDSAENPRFVATVARRGYRFLAPVEGNVPSPPPTSIILEPSLSRKPLWRQRIPWIVGALFLLSFGISIGFHVAMRQVTTSHITKRRLTANPAEVPVRMNGLSPDGHWLVFADTTGFYIRDVNSGETHAIAVPAEFGLPGPTGYPYMSLGNTETTTASWFPDGSHFVFSWPIGEAQSPSLWEISPFGGSPRKLTDNAYQPAVSPDGSQIAFLTGRDFRHELWLMRSNGEDRRKLLDMPTSACGTPTWSPDGRHIALVRTTFGKVMMQARSEVQIVDVISGGVRSVLQEEELGMSLGWTADNHLIYSLQEPPPNQNDSNLWAVRLSPGADGTSGKPERLTNDSGIVASLSLSRDGQRLAFSKHTIQPDVYVAELETKGTHLGALKRLTLDERQDYPFAWTADSRSVIFSSDRNGAFNIYRQEIDKYEPELLAGGKDELFSSRISPDGSQLLYDSVPIGPASSPRLLRIPLAGGSPQLVYEAKTLTNFQCARLPSTVCLLSEIVGDKLSFHYFDPIKGIGNKISRGDLSTRSYKTNWTLSPDGRMLAISASDNVGKPPAFQLLSVSNDLDRDIPLPGYDRINFIDWTADGTALWVSASRAGKATLLHVDLRGNIRPVLSEGNMTLGWAIPSPDGKHLAIWKDSGSLNVWMMEKF